MKIGASRITCENHVKSPIKPGRRRAIQNERQHIRKVRIGKNVRLYDFINLYECTIGDYSQIGTFCEIQKGVTVGKNCKISSHTFICEGVTIGDGVFIGHNVTFINDKYPRAVTADGKLKSRKDWHCLKTRVGKGASIGSGAVIMGGVTIGKNAMIGAGSVVTHNVPANTTVYGNPACRHSDLRGQNG